MAQDGPGKDKPAIYQSVPPKWLPTSSTSGDLGERLYLDQLSDVSNISHTRNLQGFPGFYPPYPGQEEDLLTDSNVKSGFTLKHVVNVRYGQDIRLHFDLLVPQAETYNAKDVLLKTLKDDNIVPELEDFMNQVFQRRADNLPKVP